MKPEDALKAQFHCTKCRCNECHVNSVVIPQGLLSMHWGRFLLATCLLCGHTEFYNLAVFEKSCEAAKEGDELRLASNEGRAAGLE